MSLHAQFEMYTPGVAKATKEYYASYDQEFPGIQTGHIGFFYPPISEDETDRANYVNAVDDALKFAEELDAHHSTLTPPIFTSEMTKEYDVLLGQVRQRGLAGRRKGRKEKRGDGNRTRTQLDS